MPVLPEWLAHRLGGPRIVALPLLRILAAVLGFVWVGLTPATAGRSAAALIVAGFLAYSVAVIVALWLRPPAVLRGNVLVLLADVAFALALIAVTGGASSVLFLALLLIAGLESYYYGMRRGLAVAAGTGAAYLAVVWPTLGAAGVADVVVRVAALLGTAAGVGVLADLEEQERAKVGALSVQAQARERFISDVMESLHEGVVALDPDGRVVAWNAAMARRYDIGAEEVVGQKFFEFFPNIAREPWADALRQLLRGTVNEIAVNAVEHETLRRGRVVLNLRGSVLRQSGRPAGAVLLVEDITERVELERSARRADKLASLGTLAAGIAHELNNPIGIISARAELLLLDADARRLPAEVRADLRVVHQHAQRVARIASALLSFARPTPGERSPVDLNRVVEDTLVLIEKTIVREGITLTRALAPDLPPVWGDAHALQQVVMNLLTNARDALGDGGLIEIRTSPAPEPIGGIRLVIRDTGPGIPPEVLPRVFDPFFTTKRDGTGLGLSISYGIVRDHQGTVDVQSRPGLGTTFVLTFPGAVTRTSV